MIFRSIDGPNNSRETICINTFQTLLPFILFLFLFIFIQGCSLLFTIKGNTSISTFKVEEAPYAASLSKSMSRADVIHYKIQEGDTLDFIVNAFYGKASYKKKLAQENHLDPAKPLKPGKEIRIVNPVNFPAKDELGKMRQEWSVKKGGLAVPSDLDAQVPPEVAKEVVKVPRPKANLAFAPGEKLKFEVRAIGILGGYAFLEVGDYVNVQGRPCYQLIERARSAFPLTTFYPVHDEQTSYFDAVDFLTWKFENDVHEGDYNAHNRETYDQMRHTVVRQHNQEPTSQVDVQPFTQDIISCAYYCRLLPLEAGKAYLIPTSSTGKNYKMVVKVISRENITVPAGTFDCLHAKPYVKGDTVFRNKGDIDIWVTADKRHIPVLLKSGIVIGSVEVALLDATVPDINGDGGKLVSRLSQ